MTQYNIIGTVLFSESLTEIRNQLESLRKDQFDPRDRIVIQQDCCDEYPYTDMVGSRLIEIQRIINQVDISNCFILLVTPNANVCREIEFVTKFFSVDPIPIEFKLVEGMYKKEIKKYQNTACQKLWNHLYIGTDGNINPCCVADHRFPLGNINDTNWENTESQIAQIRQDMMQGHRNRACSSCYEKEDSGIKSLRRVCDPGSQVSVIKDIDVRLSNTCNFKCRMCSEYFSSAIQQETIELYGNNALLGFEKISLERSTKNTRDQQLIKILSFVTPHLRNIYFAGGEPLITDEHYKILDRLREIGNTDLEIRYNTNLSTLFYKQIYVIDVWHYFGDVTVGASIDASGSVAEYMRHGTIWKTIVDNVHVIKQHAPHVKLQINSVVSSLTIENLINLQCQWINQRLFSVDDFLVRVLTSPNFLSPAVLPQHHKDRLSAAIKIHIERFAGTKLAQQWSDVLHWMNTHDYTFALKDFAQRTRVLDSHRNESFEKIFPEYQDLV